MSASSWLAPFSAESHHLMHRPMTVFYKSEQQASAKLTDLRFALKVSVASKSVSDGSTCSAMTARSTSLFIRHAPMAMPCECFESQRLEPCL
jgi:hypothetical protein